MTHSTPPPSPEPDGYRLTPAGGPRVRTDIVDVYIFKRAKPGSAADLRKSLPFDRDAPFESTSPILFLQLLRASEPLAGTWHPVMGHVEPGETAVQCALRELEEEVGLSPRDAEFEGMWALEQVHPFYVAAIDAIVLSPRFAVEVWHEWEPRLDPRDHSRHHWIPDDDAPFEFLWPGQRAAVREILESLLPPGSPNRELLRVRV